ncbi:hypothetical protein LCI18_010757 [Fusarium solani-melongenae]|uniref:Uncharacterized protein n=1 Tax=Fusarium solani subsp. cucurbitae TaxID=2747967 RepID=A0ACD3ZFS4_FUSSC|nr:hypothetical protein LCI18_010757 [Fusarium solani-melongenae]
MTSSEPASFLHLPPEIRNLIYDLAFNPDVKTNILGPAHSGYTRGVSPLLYVHPAISADLRQRTYGGDFSLVLPIQEPSGWVKGRGLDSDKLQTCLNNLPDLMKKKCERLIVEASQSDEVEDDDYEFWYSGDFPNYLIPLLLQIKEEVPRLKKITFIFWFGEWSAPVDVWKKSLLLLSRQWNKKVQGQNGNANADKSFTSKSYRAKPSIEMQFNLFDYYDHDGGDGGENEYLMWYCFAGHERSRSVHEDGSDLDDDEDEDGDDKNRGDDKKSDDDESQGSDEGITEDGNENEDEDYNDYEATAISLGLRFTFRAMDLHWDDHVNGNFEGKEFDPNVWDNDYFHTMSPKKRDRVAHKYWHVTETCKPLFIKKAGGPLS